MMRLWIGAEFLPRVLVLITIFVLWFGCPSWRIGMEPNFRVNGLLGAVAAIRHRVFMYMIVALTVLEFTADLIVESTIARPLGLGYGTEGIWPGHSGGP